jgi:hypothetical protein
MRPLILFWGSAKLEGCSGRNRSNGEDIMPARSGDFDRPFDVLLTFDLAEIKFMFSESRVEPAIRQSKSRPISNFGWRH